jgi:flagellar hook-associated protein 1
MGLVSSLNNAVSALNVNQQNLNILSQNIANANTPNYSTQVANQQASFINGLPQGVSIASITRKVNEFLTAQIRVQTSSSNAADVTQNYFQQVENLLGQPGGTNSVDQNVNALFTALQNMANVPSSSAQTTVVNAASTLTAQISGLANSVQTLRLQADTEIGNSVNSVNTILKKLHSLNTSLERAAATNENQAGLLDERDAALKELSQYLDIITLIQANGSVNVNTSSGTTLVGTNLTQLSYQSASSVQTFTSNGTLSALQVLSYNQDGVATGRPATLVTSGVSGTNGTDSTITSSIPSGKLGALIEVRDSVLPKIIAQLDELAASLRDEVNKITNSGVSSPTPNSYTGERLVGGTRESAYSGSIRIAVLNENGSPVASPYADEPYGLQPLTLDLSTLDTGNGAGNVSTDGLINAINQYFAQPQAKLKLGDLNNVQLALASDSVPASGNTVSFDFSLNNISKNSTRFYVTDATVLDSNGVTVDASPTLDVPSLALASSNTYQTTAGSNLVTITTAGSNTLVDGDVIYLPPPSPTTTVGGFSSDLLGGFFTVQNVSGNTFQIAATGAVAASVTTDSLSASGVSALTNYATAEAGETVRTGLGGLITADLSTNATSPYYTIQANIATVDADGNIKTSTVTYRIGASTAGARNDLFGVRSQAGDGTIVQPTIGGSQLTASLVDANGTAIQKVNGIYGNKQGYLKISATDSTKSIAIDSLDSKQLGVPTSAGNAPGTNQGFSQYFGLNNFFKTNSLTATGDTLTNSALNFAITKRILNNPTFISIGTLTQSNQPANPAQPANYTYRMNAGDNSISQRLAELSTLSIKFDSAGGLPVINTTFSQYSGLIIAQTSTNLINANNAKNDTQTLLEGFTEQSQNISGVNLDQELANTVIFQNAYTASTRVITVVSALFQDLLGIIR